MPQQPNEESTSKLFDEMASEFTRLVREGRSPDIDEFANRHSELEPRVRRLFPVLKMMESRGDSWEWSEVDQADIEPELAGANEKWQAPERLGDFRLIRQIGRGGMGIVYEAEQESLGRRVAIKILPASAQFDERRVERFATEARASAMLHHTNIVPVFGIGRENGLSFFVMQLINGQPLNRVLRDIARIRDLSTKPLAHHEEPTFSKNQIVRSMFGEPEGTAASDATTEKLEFAKNVPTPVASSVTSSEAVPSMGSVLTSASVGSSSESGSLLHSERGETTGVRSRNYFRNVARVGVKVSEALEHAHGYGILHRDIKPSNLLLDENGAVWVTDFGLAKYFDSPDITRTGEVVGTLRYMAPEQLDGRASCNSDIFGLGLTLYEMLTLQPAYQGTDKKRLLEKVTEANPTNPRSIDSRIPRDLETIVMKCIHSEPSKRYSSAVEVSEDLTRFLDGQPILARRIDVFEKAWKWCCRRPSLAITVAALAASILVGICGIGWQWSKAVDALEDARVATARAEKHFNQAREAVSQIVDSISEEELLSSPSLLPVRVKLIRKALAYQTEFAKTHPDDPNVQIELANAFVDLGGSYFELARDEDTLLYHGKAEAILVPLLETDLLPAERTRARIILSDSIRSAAAVHLRKSATGEKNYFRAIEVILDGREESELEDSERRQLAKIYRSIGMWAESLTRSQPIRLTNVTESPLEYYQKAYELVHGLAVLEHTKDFRSSLLASLHNDLGIAYRKKRDNKTALKHYQKAAEQFRSLVKSEPGNTLSRFGLGEALSSLGYFHGFTLGDTELGLSFYQQAISEYEKLASEYPSVLRFTESQARASLNCGMLCEDDGKLEEAFKFRKAALNLSQRVLLFAPDSPKLISDYGKALVGVGINFAERGDDVTAIDYFNRAQEQHELAVEKSPRHPLLRSRLFYSLMQSGQSNRDLGNFAQSQQIFVEAIDKERATPEHYYIAGRELLRLALKIRTNVADSEVAKLKIADNAVQSAKGMFEEIVSPKYEVRSRIVDDESFEDVLANQIGKDFLDWLATEQTRVAELQGNDTK